MSVQLLKVFPTDISKQLSRFHHTFEMTKSSLANMFGKTYFGVLMHFVCLCGCVLILLAHVIIIPTMFVKDIKGK
jgi:hypothetical protein